MKIRRVLSLCLLLLPLAGAAGADSSFLALSGLDRMLSALNGGCTLASCYYTSGAGADSAEFETEDPGEAAQLLQALSQISIAGVSGESAGDEISAVIFRLSDGSRYSVRFSRGRLETGGMACDLSGDEAFRALVSSLAAKYARPGAAAPFSAGGANSVDLYLPAITSTGYAWSASAEDEGIVRVTDRLFSSPQAQGTPGAPETHWFHLDGAAEGTTAVRLAYARPWDASPVYTLVCRLTVDASGSVLIWGFEMLLP